MYCAWCTANEATDFKKSLGAKIGEESENASGDSVGWVKDGQLKKLPLEGVGRL